ncbi:MAG TPA: folylpolyglutamate synthase/dihydrofolate synthase family protein [Bacteroidia bacterium]|nr:folylpolyglutamate synthase/dihydrofolate synthase family protein [Bacteroidia bacterium]
MAKGFTSYRETLDYLYSRLPMFQRVGVAAYKADLKNTVTLCKTLGNPEKKFRSIHIAGTNGKGSTAHLLAAILQVSGYKTGLYTSPHLKSFRERIRINGQKIKKERVVEFVNRHHKEFEKTELSFFEWTVGLAFDHFANEKVDVAVIETGLGGRLDSTNVIMPDLSVITNVSYDHMNLLGKTLAKIAAEKAGIIKKNIPVVIGETQEEIKSVFIEKARSHKAPLFFADKDFSLKNIAHTEEIPPDLVADVYEGTHLYLKKIRCALPGLYQRKNIVTVIAAVEQLRDIGFRIPENAIYKAFRNVGRLTHLQGRWQVISKKPLVIADTAHNEAGVREVVAQLKKTPYKKLHIVFGVVKDKDPSAVLRLLPKQATYYFCNAKIPRAMDAGDLRAAASEFGLKGERWSSVKKAMRAAEDAAGPKDLVFVGGSMYVVAEVI